VDKGMDNPNKKGILNIVFVIFVSMAVVLFFVLLYIRMSPLRFMEDVSVSIKRLNDIGLKVYQSGNNAAAEIALSKVIDELVKIKPYTKGDKELAKYYDFELGLAHARLFKTYLEAGRLTEANKEYENAINLISRTYPIANQEELIKLVDLLSK
jgi:hypothetical protein